MQSLQYNRERQEDVGNSSPHPELCVDGTPERNKAELRSSDEAPSRFMPNLPRRVTRVEESAAGTRSFVLGSRSSEPTGRLPRRRSDRRGPVLFSLRRLLCNGRLGAEEAILAKISLWQK